MTHLVTGAAGFIGSHLTQHLLDLGEQVVGVDDLNDHYDPTLKEWRQKQLQGQDGFTFVKGDITNRQTVEQIFQDHDPETVYNLAAHAGVRDSIEDPNSYLDVNVTGALNLLEGCRAHDVSTYLLASTSSLYGHHNDVPFSEDARTDIPPSPYAASKKAAEAYAAAYAELYGMDCPVVRYFTVYGPAGRPDMSVFRFIRWVAEDEPITIYGDGNQKRDFTYVTDVVRGTRMAAEEVDGFEVVNLGNDDPVGLMKMIEVVEACVGKEAELEFVERHPADMDATWADISKAQRMLGWAPEVTLDEGVERTVDWYMQESGWARAVAVGDE